MPILTFTGKVTTGDPYRCSEEGVLPDGAILIAGIDILAEIAGGKFSGFAGPVTVGIADERYSGPLAWESGWGYSEYTPVDEDKLTVGHHNLIEILSRYENQTITLWIADEPFNTLEAPAYEAEATRGKRALVVSDIPPAPYREKRG